MSKFVVYSLPSRSRRPRLELCQRKRFSQKQFRLRFTTKRTCTILQSTKCIRTRQSRYETVGDGSDEGDIAGTGSFYSARGIDSQALVGAAVGEERWAGMTHILASLMLAQSEQFERITMYVVSNKLFWN